MLPIFEKLENVKINALDLLRPEDKTYCENIFNLYNAHCSFIKNLLDETRGGYKKHLEQYPLSADDFYYAMYNMEKQMEGFENIMILLDARIAFIIEDYFHETYNIKFDSFNNKLKKDKEVILENIIDNIIQQSGTDLIQAGKNQIVIRFQKLLSKQGKTASLKNNKISFFNYFYLRSNMFNDNVSLEGDDYEIGILLDALALFLFEATGKPEIFTIQFDEWKRNIDFSKTYLLQENLSIRFFKNRRIDLVFKETETTEKFWEKFQLENL